MDHFEYLVEGFSPEIPQIFLTRFGMPEDLPILIYQ